MGRGFVVGLLVWLAGGSGLAQAQASPVRGGTLRVGLAAANTTMDLHTSVAVVDRQIAASIFNALVGLDKDLHIVPELAESWAWSDRGRTLTLKLRRGVKFHDGTDFNAPAVKANFERILDPAMNSPRRSDLAVVASIEVPDDFTVRLLLKSPSASLLSLLTDRTGQIMSPAAIKKFGKDIARNPVGTGPFQFVEWVKDDHLTLKRFDAYWEKDLPYLDGIVYRPVPDESVKFTTLRTGHLDLIDTVAPRDIARLKESRELAYAEATGMGFRAIFLNTTKPPFDKQPLREAVSVALDRAALHRGVYLGIGIPGTGPISATSWARDPGLKPVAFNLAQAKAKLAEGGQPSGLKFTMQVYNIPLDIQVAQAMKAQLAQAGIDAELQVLERGAVLANLRGKTYTAAMSGFSGRPDPDPEIYNFFHSKGATNYSGYRSGRVDELLDKARETGPVEERKKLYWEAERIVVEEAPAIFYYQPWDPQIKGMSPRVQGFTLFSDGILRLKGVWLSR
jgi:peptide/nickel transport system substrate-binding protein